jgi:hypothetical protein
LSSKIGGFKRSAQTMVKAYLSLDMKKMDIGFKPICAYPDGDFKNLTITKRLIQSSDIRIGEYPMDRIAPEKESKAPLEGRLS